MHIAPPIGQHEALLPNEVREDLEALYAQVPGVSCQACDRPGKCCELTGPEFQADFATMYPLYAVEYLNIVDHVSAHFDAARREELLEMVDERPMRCPFLTQAGGCSIHPARPLTCRTYGVLNREQEVFDAAKAAQGQAPENWLQVFKSSERYTVCAHTALLEPEKREAHVKAMWSFDYERRMVAMSQSVALMDADRQAIFQEASGKAQPIRWTWGGFNALVQTPLSWFKRRVAQVWSESILGE